MKSNLFVTRLVFAGSLALSAVVLAHEPAEPKPAPAAASPAATMGMPVFVQNIAPAAVDAVKVVDAFSAAIKAVKIDEAAKLLDPTVLILESGSSERSRDEYLGEHAIADAAFMQTTQQQLRYRQAQVSGDVAWVGTESLLTTMKDGKATMFLSTETMVLKNTAEGWRIVHIHWSSRPAPKGGQQPDPTT